MESVRNHSSPYQNQSHFDDERRASQASPAPRGSSAAGSRDAIMSCPPPPAPLRSEASAPRARAQDAAAGYTSADGSTQVSRDAVSELVKRASKPKAIAPGASPERSKTGPDAQREPAAEEKTLCQKRKYTNQVLCGFLGSVAAARLVPGSTAKAVAGSAAASPAIASICESTFNWLEENAPGGACGKP